MFHDACITEELLASTKVKGFPVVKPQGSLTIGYIGRAELQFAIGKLVYIITVVDLGIAMKSRWLESHCWTFSSVMY